VLVLVFSTVGVAEAETDSEIRIKCVRNVR